MLRKVIGSPLLHFVVLGAVIFFADGALEARAQRDIHVSADVVLRLVDLWRGQAMREPSAAERASLIETHIREEILYREARALGLDRDDAIIRRRLAQKIEFLAEDVADVEAPDAATLDAFYASRAETYRTPERVTFVHVFFAGADAAQRAQAARADLAASPDDWHQIGDPFMLRREYAERPLAEFAASFGTEFAGALAAAPTGAWSGPATSTYGSHLLRVDARLPSELPPLAAVRETVVSDWVAVERERRNQQHYQDLRARYRIVIEEPMATLPRGEGDRPSAVSGAARAGDGG